MQQLNYSTVFRVESKTGNKIHWRYIVIVNVAQSQASSEIESRVDQVQSYSCKRTRTKPSIYIALSYCTDALPKRSRDTAMARFRIHNFTIA